MKKRKREKLWKKRGYIHDFTFVELKWFVARWAKNYLGFPIAHRSFWDFLLDDYAQEFVKLGTIYRTLLPLMPQSGIGDLLFPEGLESPFREEQKSE